MRRTISYKGQSIVDESLVVGNHGNAHIQIDGHFRIDGLIYCPKKTLKISIKGDGTIKLHGVCKDLDIKYVDGNCFVDFSDLKATEVRCRKVTGSCTLRLGEFRNLAEYNLGQEAVIEMCHSTLAGRYQQKHTKILAA